MTETSTCKVIRPIQAGQQMRISQNYRLPLCIIRKIRNNGTLETYNDNPQYYVDSDKKKQTECPLCNLSSQLSLYSIGDCKHKFCLTCLHFYITYKLFKRQKVQCPYQACKQNIDASKYIYKTLPISVRLIYQKKVKRSKLKANEKLCLTEGCKGIISKSKGQDFKEITCQSCCKTYCKFCLSESHTNSCDIEDLLVYEQIVNLRRCIKCKQLANNSEIEHIKCSCGYQYCYMCQNQWSQNHVHGSIKTNWCKISCLTFLVILTVLICIGFFGGITFYTVFVSDSWINKFKK